MLAGLVLCLALGLVSIAVIRPGLEDPTPSAPVASASPIVNPRTDASATTRFGERLVVRRDGQELAISLVTPEGLESLASFELPDDSAFVVARQLICPDGTGPERSLIVFGATSPAPAVGSLSMELFDGAFTKTTTGVFLFVGSDPPIGGKRWVLKDERRTIVSGSVVLVMPADPDNPPSARCDDFDPEATG
jgi:hypothetical protein